MPLKLYDIEIDDTREPTQEDIDRLTAVQQAYGKLRAFMAQTHAELLVEIERARRRRRAVVWVDTEVASGDDGTQEEG
jgi:hypothetical protein